MSYVVNASRGDPRRRHAIRGANRVETLQLPLVLGIVAVGYSVVLIITGVGAKKV